jgi:tripartite-type tricarboxylate transporter receptor subunit TctC
VPVVNKPGAGGVLGAKEVAAARPDGYTLGVFSTAVVTAQYTVETPTRLADYQAIGLIETSPAALAVKADAPWKSVRELVAHAKANPEKIRIGMIPGASAQVFAGGFAEAAKVRLTMVPFPGDAPGATALAGGHIEAHVAVPVSYKTLVEANKVRILGIAADARVPSLPGVATFKEDGVDFVIASFHALFAPARTPAPVLAALETALGRAMREPGVLEQLAKADMDASWRDRAGTAAFIAQQDAVYRSLIERLGMAYKKN